VDEQRIRDFVAKKLIFYRRQKGLTQSELAEKINYSDKSVSKWERAEGMPDICVLNKIGEICNFSLEDFFGDEDMEKKRIADKKKKVIVPILSVGILWLAALLACFILQVSGLAGVCPIILISSVPAMFIIFIVFSALWWSLPVCAGMVSGLIWSAVVCIHFLLPDIKPMYSCIVAAVFQIMTILWVLLRIQKVKIK
jgi:transcriptional regulator with XRE-family HTH domain